MRTVQWGFECLRGFDDGATEDGATEIDSYSGAP
jgi:hypothetical protein